MSMGLRLTLAAAALLLGATGATGQSFADLQAGPIAPCLADHFDPVRYQDELAAQGWVPAPEELREAVIEILAVGFLPLTHPAPVTQADDAEARLGRARAVWVEQLAAGLALVQGDSVLLLRGVVQPDRFRRLDCFLITPDAGFVNGLIAQSEEPVPEGAEVAVALGPFPVSERAEALVLPSRNPTPPGPVWGVATQTMILPAD
jgi:hypothetical protein